MCKIVETFENKHEKMLSDLTKMGVVRHECVEGIADIPGTIIEKMRNMFILNMTVSRLELNCNGKCITTYLVRTDTSNLSPDVFKQTLADTDLDWISIQTGVYVLKTDAKLSSLGKKEVISVAETVSYNMVDQERYHN